MLMRLKGQSTAKHLSEVAMMLTEGTVASTADHAKELAYLQPTDTIVYHPDRLITEAKEVAVRVEVRDIPEWARMEGPLTGMIDRLQNEARARGTITEYDEVVGDKIKSVFAKSTSYADALAKEREEFVELCGRPLTLARIRHMLDTGKPLRN